MNGWMLVYADLHGRMPDIWRDCDFIILAGDICPDLPPDEQAQWLDGPFRQWLKQQTIPIIAVAGNHDPVFECGLHPTDLPWYYLENEAITINDRKFFGSPWCLRSGAFSVNEDEELAPIWESIPKDTEVLITHYPPFGILDVPLGGPNANNNEGSFTLLDNVRKNRYPLHLFGHNHDCRGSRRNWGTYFVNCTSGSYKEPIARYDPWGLSDCSWKK